MQSQLLEGEHALNRRVLPELDHIFTTRMDDLARILRRQVSKRQYLSNASAEKDNIE